ncbi:dehydrodolichyl diphosphate synthase CPT3-like [Malania oleifera]|uniref:dehydrodolichyl diphosphate synthase CPT3-like n=1 Tax=Malania oleifera TaxID=397392 RepID=UPI0025AE1573|nr:dehydrodolichyl diphosphate synthase CPT3-like [Malania oleifera]
MENKKGGCDDSIAGQLFTAGLDNKSSSEDSIASQIFWNISNLLRKAFFSVLSVGPVPSHVAFILDGNRRFAKKNKLSEGAGHVAGFLAVINMLKYCYELGIKYATIYAFSLDNYRRRPDEVQLLMNLMQIKMEELNEVRGLVNQFGVRVYFIGNIHLLPENVRKAAEKLMETTAKNTKAVLAVCLAYTSTNEIMLSVRQSCEEKWKNCPVAAPAENGMNGTDTGGWQKGECIEVGDLEKHMFMAVTPEPDILVRTSGETRLSNFLLWQTTHCLLYSPFALWPEIGFQHLVWAVLNFQRHHAYFQKNKEKEKLKMA